MADTQPAADPAPLDPAAQRQADLQDLSLALQAGRRALEVVGPVLTAFPAAMSFFDQAHRLVVTADAAGREAELVQANLDQLKADLAARQADYATAVAALTAQLRDQQASTAAAIAAMQDEVARARTGADADIRGADAAVAKAKKGLAGVLAKQQEALDAQVADAQAKVDAR